MSDKSAQMNFMTVFASAVHDMKNSLNMMLSSIEALEEGCVATDDPAQAARGRLRYEAQRVNAGLIEILTLYKFQTSMYPLNIQYHAVGDFLEERSLEYRPMLEARGVALETDWAEDLNWFFDDYLITSVIGNVVNNAIRYTDRRLKISAAEESGFLVICVEDDGQGYPDRMLEQQEAIQAGIDTGAGNTGLGLYFSCEVARKHQKGGRVGRIQLQNGGSYGGGRFSLYLP